ncbi:hypothetical protein [Stieleria varia]|uniref:Uncharacterized protein n=1 Tax=Stieleria varia TaxID=2528005 RepID=A0A5C6B241_9BACT|nr:hypothetical protein [Stieleria varia]TWU05907.1 hypothetical protein Pla52n_16230 [Stieleria varia]
MIGVKIKQTFVAVFCFSIIFLQPLQMYAGGPLTWFNQSDVEKLAGQIDCLEKHIEKYGSVVAKKPDVWGEARLTRHRSEFEQVMSEELNGFKETINATLTRADSAYLANAFALSAALQEGVSLPSAKESDAVAIITDDGITKRAEAAIARSNPRANATLGFKASEGGIALEPVIKLDQMKRYLDHLNEIRRTNEGDDVGDSPGYAINLVRIPVSVLPGNRTQEGYGAEISVTATPHLSEETLPQVFQSWVINDLVDELTLPVLRHADLKTWDTLLKRFLALYEYLDANGDFPPQRDIVYGEVLNEILNGLYTKSSQTYGTRPVIQSADVQKRQSDAILEIKSVKLDLESIEQRTSSQIGSSRSRHSRYSVPASLRPLVYGRSFHRINYKGQPTPYLFELDRLSELAKRINQTLALTQYPNGQIPNTEVRDFLREELKASYDFLIEAGRRNPAIWDLTEGLYEIIRDGRDLELLERQKLYAHLIGDGGDGRSIRMQPQNEYQVTEDLAWCILVESALLNRQLIDDMQRLAADKNAPCVVSTPLDRFYLPSHMLAPETTYAFNEYVKCRWPIKVFALDPVTQDQNVADAFSLRRELQLAASIAFASGEIGISNFSQFARRIELDAETIALNRTVIGFSHGDDTFGWRFRPRYQTPEIKGTIQAFGQTLFGGPSRNSLLKDQRIEPGIRECTAIVIAPNFVPYLTFDTRANWYKLTRPGWKQFDLKDSTSLGKEIVELRRAKAACVAEQHLHRDGEVYRLMRAVDQLEARLPLQTTFVQMPTEDTKGGFQTLSGGTTNLGPELVGFYGQPGYDPTKDSSFFLVGDNFSVHDTRVIAGGEDLRTRDVTQLVDVVVEGEEPKQTAVVLPSQVRMLSRDILEVRLPKELKPYEREYDEGKKRKVIAVQVGTPYGVSAVLEIPVFEEDKKAEETAAATAAAKAVTAHVEALHPVSYGWEKTPDATATVVFDTGGINVLDIHDGIGMLKLEMNQAENKDVHDLLNTGDAIHADIVFRVEATSNKEGTSSVKGKTIGPLQITLGMDFDPGQLEVPLQAALRSSILPSFDLKEISLQGYVRFYATDGHDSHMGGRERHRDRPIFKLTNALKIKVTEATKCEVECVPALTPPTTVHSIPIELLQGTPLSKAKPLTSTDWNRETETEPYAIRLVTDTVFDDLHRQLSTVSTASGR